MRGDLRACLRRRSFFPGVWLGDPSWDMLLELEVAALEGRRVLISSLCIASGAPATTALRYIVRMERTGWLARRPDPSDRRREFIGMTPRARQAMARWRGTDKSAPSRRSRPDQREARARWLVGQLARLLAGNAPL